MIEEVPRQSIHGIEGKALYTSHPTQYKIQFSRKEDAMKCDSTMKSSAILHQMLGYSEHSSSCVALLRITLETNVLQRDTAEQKLLFVVLIIKTYNNKERILKSNSSAEFTYTKRE